jgi:hypothetical protein
LRIALVQLACNSAGSIVSSLVLVLGGYLLLRRLRAEGQLPARPCQPFPEGEQRPTQVASGQEPFRAPAKEPEGVAGEEACRNFGLGLTYEEEMGLKQEAERHQEEALLRHLHEQNVRMLEQIRELEGAVA